MTAQAAAITLDQSPFADQPTRQDEQQPVASIRDQLVAPFIALGSGVEPRAAFPRTREWYRASGGAWTQRLS